tara:strand:+ start:455 stop:670 length:216 start_codon:yes stop_codon:yes gene_type:complete
MKKPDKLILIIKETNVYHVEVSEETGYDAFPDSVLEMVDYVNEIRGNLESYIIDQPVPIEHEVELISIKEE